MKAHWYFVHSGEVQLPCCCIFSAHKLICNATCTQFVEGLELTKFHLIGESLGACVSAIYGSQYPDRLRTLTTLCPPSELIVCLSVRPSVCLSVCLSILSVCLSVCPTVQLSDCPAVCDFVACMYAFCLWCMSEWMI